jgi:hypothetical protein
MSFEQPLNPELEGKAQELLARLRAQADEDLLALARLLVSKEDRELFGDTEFQVRDIVHRIGTKAYETHLAQKKRLRGFWHRLPALPTKCEIPRTPLESGLQLDGYGDVPAGVLLLRPLWQRGAAVGRPGRLDGAVLHAGSRATGQLGGRLE